MKPTTNIGQLLLYLKEHYKALYNDLSKTEESETLKKKKLGFEHIFNEIFRIAEENANDLYKIEQIVCQ